MRLEKTVPYLRQGKRIYRESWRDSYLSELNELFLLIDGDDEHFEYETRTQHGTYKMSVSDILALDWKIEGATEDLGKRVLKFLEPKPVHVPVHA